MNAAKISVITALGLLLCGAEAAAQRPAAARSLWRVGVGNSTFLTQWDGYTNSVTRGELHGFYRSRAFLFEADLRASNSPSFPFLGNLEAALFRTGLDRDRNFELSVGRHPDKPAFVRHFSVHDAFNHKICYTALDCSRGGPIGISLRIAQRFQFGVQALTIPNISPLISADAQGRLSSRDRWSAIPYSEVDVNGRVYPLRASVLFPSGAASFFRPGLWSDWSIVQGSDGGLERSLRLVTSLAPSQSARSTKNNRLGFEAAADGNPGVVVSTTLEREHPMRALASLQGVYEFSYFRLLSEASYLQEKGGKPQGLGSVFVAPNLPGFHVRFGGGVHHSKGRSSLFSQNELFYLLGRVKIGALSDYLFGAPQGRALYLRPQIGYVYAPRSEISLSSDLIRADADALFYGPIAGNDQITLRMTYEF